MRLIPILMAIAVVAGLYFWIVPGSGEAAPEAGAPAVAQAPAEEETRPIRVVAFESQARPVDRAILLRGRTEARRLVDVRAETGGLVVSEPLRAGAEVEEGQLLCRLDSGAREAQLAQAEAALEQARADADAANQLAERGLTAQNTAKARRAALSAARAALREIEIDTQRLEIRTPFDGVLETDSAEIGSLVRTGDICARVISLDPIKLVGFVPEADVDQLHEGMPAGARLVSGREVQGRIAFVSRSADETTRTFRVEISAPNPDRTIRDGVTAEIMIPLEAREAHLAPQAALTLNDEGVLGVRTVDDGIARFHRAEIMREEPQGVWLAGLPERSAIIYVGQEFVTEGRRVDATLQPWRPAE